MPSLPCLLLLLLHSLLPCLSTPGAPASPPSVPYAAVKGPSHGIHGPNKHCYCLSWGCQPACPCACPCPCGDQSLCGPLSSTKSGPEVLAFHAHLYNESGDRPAHPRTGAQNFRLYPWENLTTVAV